MTTRTTIGDNFKGAVNYQFTGRLDAPTDKQPLILLAEGVRADNAQVMSDDFQWGCSLNRNLGKPVWHTVISFNPDDTAKLTNEKMLAVAQDFRKEMGLLNTQCVIFRHFDKEDNEHLHILANRVANDGHSIPDGRNFYRSKLAMEKLVPAHELTPAAGQRPDLQHPERIVGAYDKAGAEIRQALAYGLQTATERASLWQELLQKDIVATESSRGVTFAKDGYTFKGSQVARQYSLGGIDQQLGINQAAQARQAEQQRQAEARENEQVRQQAQQVLRDLISQQTFASRAEFTGQVAAHGYAFVTGPAGEALLRHEASQRQFGLEDVRPGGAAARPLWEQVDEVIEVRAAAELVRQAAELARQAEELARQAAELARQAARREEARRETEQAMTQTRDSGLSRPEQFFYRLRTQPYDLLHDPQTGQLTHVRHQGSGEVFAWAQVQPGGPGAPPLAEQLAAAVQAGQPQVAARQQLAAGREWAEGRVQVESVVAQVRGEQYFSNRAELQACLQVAGVTWLPSSTAGHPELFRLDATGQLFWEKEVLRTGTVADLLTEAEERWLARRQTAWEQTKQDVVQTLQAPKSPLTGVKNYQQQLEAGGYKFQQTPGQAMEIEHLASGERFLLTEVQPGGPAAAPLVDQVRAELAQQKQQLETQTQATKVLEQVLAAESYFSWPHCQAQVQAQGYQFVTGLDGQTRLLHEASRQHVALTELRPHGRDLASQVNESLAARQADLVQGYFEVRPTAGWSAADGAASVQEQLVARGAWVESAPESTTGGGVGLLYIHPVKGARLDEVNEWLGSIHLVEGVTVREQPKGASQFPADWPARRGEYGQATLLCTRQAYQDAAAQGVSVAAQLTRTGATVREVPGAPAGMLQLEVSYHTQRTDVSALSGLLDQWAGEVPGFQVRETERARQARDGQLPQAEKAYDRGI